MIALVETLLIPIGVPVAAFVLMYMNRGQILAENEDVLAEFDGLLGDYKSEYYYWCVITARSVTSVTCAVLWA